MARRLETLICPFLIEPSPEPKKLFRPNNNTKWREDRPRNWGLADKECLVEKIFYEKKINAINELTQNSDFECKKTVKKGADPGKVRYSSGLSF